MIDEMSTYHLSKAYSFVTREWGIYASVNQVIIGSNNGLLSISGQAISRTNDGLLLVGPLGINVNDFFYQSTIGFVHKK